MKARILPRAAALAVALALCTSTTAGAQPAVPAESPAEPTTVRAGDERLPNGSPELDGVDAVGIPVEVDGADEAGPTGQPGRQRSNPPPVPPASTLGGPGRTGPVGNPSTEEGQSRTAPSVDVQIAEVDPAAQAELEAAAIELARIQSELRVAYTAVLTLDAERVAAQRQEAQSRAAHRLSVASHERAEKDLADAETAFDVAVDEHEAAQADLDQSTVAAYTSAPAADAEIVGLLSSGRFGQARTAQVYRSAALDHLDIEAERNERALGEAEADRDDATTRERTAGKSRLAARADLARAGDTLGDVERRVSGERTRLDELAIEQRAFGDTRAELAALAANGRAGLDGIGSLLSGYQAAQPDWDFAAPPLQQPLDVMTITSPFGSRFHPVYLSWKLHRGLDLGAPTGTPVLAAADGVVFLAEVRGGYGNTVVIDHGHSLATVNAHLSAYAVAAGDQVQAGQVVGYVGSTGVSTGPHLHFETRLRGAATQPLAFGLADYRQPQLTD